MQYSSESNIIVIRLHENEDIFATLEKIAKKEKITSAIILCGVGILKNFELGYFNDKEYLKKEYEKPMELISLSGSIALAEKQLSIHIHCSLADENHEMHGGHLFKAEVCTLNEITILKLNKIKLKREMGNKGILELNVY